MKREIESKLLGAMLMDSDVCKSATEQLVAFDFKARGHVIIFAMIDGLVKKKKAVDIITVAKNLAKNKWLEEIGGMWKLTKCLSIAYTPDESNYYIEQMQKSRKEHVREWLKVYRK